MSDFKSFDKILHVGKMYMSITQKIHGSNAQIFIYRDENGELDLKTGSRTRWIIPGDDNYGFAKFIYENKEQFISALGEGRHFGEWAGPGINSGEGLTEKTLILFNWRRWKDNPELPKNVTTLPVLYSGKLTFEAIDITMENLRLNGSRLVEDYMKPEGIVIEIGDNFYKKVFENEETGWFRAASVAKKEREDKYAEIEVGHLLQPIRLEKLLSRDEKYIRDYPESLPQICKDYIVDLEKEEQLVGTEDEIKVMKKLLGRQLFPFIKSSINER